MRENYDINIPYARGHMNNVDLHVSIGSLQLKNPVTVASGTFGFGVEYAGFYNVAELGAIFIKGLTLREREGNPPPRIAETSSGMLNSIGLQNPGVERFIKEISPVTKTIGTAIIANVSGGTIDEYIAVAKILFTEKAVDALEINVSCPNITEGGIEFGKNETVLRELLSAVIREAPTMPVIVKLTPLVTNIRKMAEVVEETGATAISMINTLPGMFVDWRKHVFAGGKFFGGLSGPAIKPVALRLIWEVRQAVSLPIIGMGGITTLDDALQFFYAGADAISIGTASFINPTAPQDILRGLTNFLHEHEIASLAELQQFLHS